MNAYIASVPLHLLEAAQMIKQCHIQDCDLYYVPTSNHVGDLLEAVKRAGLFRTVTMLPNINIEYPITVQQCAKISANRFKVRKILKDKHYDTVYYNTDGWLLNSIIYSSLPNRRSKNIFVENGVLPYIVPYDGKEWYLRLYIHCNLMPCMDGRYIDERYLFAPSLVSVPQRGEIRQIEKIDRTDPVLKRQINTIFGYDPREDAFSGKKIIIMEQGPRREPIDMYGLWEKVGRYIRKEDAIVKSHPRQKESALKKLGYAMYERYEIPWEVLTFNQDMNDKTLFTIFSTSCVNPKLMFDAEPRVILLYKLIGMDYSFFGEGMIRFVQGVRELYRDKDKFFVPESWEALEDYCRTYLQ